MVKVSRPEPVVAVNAPPAVGPVTVTPVVDGPLPEVTVTAPVAALALTDVIVAPPTAPVIVKPWLPVITKPVMPVSVRVSSVLAAVPDELTVRVSTPLVTKVAPVDVPDNVRVAASVKPITAAVV